MSGRTLVHVTECAVAVTVIGVVGALVAIVRAIDRDHRRAAARRTT